MKMYAHNLFDENVLLKERYFYFHFFFSLFFFSLNPSVSLIGCIFHGNW